MMTTTELKQRIAEAIKPFWGNYIIGRDVCQLLQDCLNHIEEMESRLNQYNSVCDDRAHWAQKASQLQSQLRERDVAIQTLDLLLRERETNCADPNLVEKLADAFVAWPLPDSVCSDRCVIESGYPHRTGTNLLTVNEAREMFRYVLSKCGVRLDASSRELLERLQAVEKERDEWRKTAGERLDLLTKAEGRALELLERLQKAESVLLKIREIGELANWHKCSDHAWTEYRTMLLINQALQPKEAK